MVLIADTGVALISLGLAWLFWTEALQVWHVYVAMLLRALGRTFHHTAMSASTALLVPEEHLARISGLNQMMFGVNGIIGPPLGALLMEWLPLHAVMLVDVVTAAPAVLVLLFVAIPQPEADPSKDIEPAGGHSWRGLDLWWTPVEYLAVAGPIGDRLGLPVFYLATGILACLSAIVLWIVPAVRHLDEGRPPSRMDSPKA